jgi:mannose-1-phosphate guanylyltransferase/mannose-6-phosphate isomerase
MSKIVPVILSGGFGTRLWPLSRECMPKQFNCDIIDPCLFSRTCDLSRMFANPIIVTNSNHQFLVEDVIGQNYDTMLLEPFSRNTMPAILAAAFWVAKTHGNDATMLVMPSDHLITQHEEFVNSVQNGMAFAHENIVIFGVQPNKPETGFGYIEVKESELSTVYNVKQFREKPNKQTAESFIKEGNFYWNAGIFLINAGMFLNICKTLAQETFDIVQDSLKNAQINGKKVELSAEFANAPSNSIDYAILEKIPNIIMTKMRSLWNDIGNFEALFEVLPKNNSNVIRGNAQAMETTNCFVQNTTNNLVVCCNIQDIAVIQTEDATLVIPLSYAQEVRKVVENLKDVTKKNESSKVYRPWGAYEILQDGVGFKVKRIIVNPGRSLSLQSHEHRAENWVVISGVATVVNGDRTYKLNVGESTFVPKQRKHRLYNETSEDIEIIEVQTGRYLGEDDITRYSDN